MSVLKTAKRVLPGAVVDRFSPAARDPFRQAVKRAKEARTHQAWSVAADEYAQALAVRDDFGVRVQYAHMLKEAGRVEEAEAQYLAALTQKPDDVDLLIQLGHFYWKIGKAEASVEYYGRAVTRDPSDVQAEHHYKMGRERLEIAPHKGMLDDALAAMDSRGWAEAETKLRFLVEKNQPSLQLLLGHTVKEQGRLPEAIDIYSSYLDHVVATGGNDRYEGEFQLAYALKIARRYSEAAYYFAQARMTRLETEGWSGSEDELLGEVQFCIRQIYPSLDMDVLTTTH